MTITAKYDGTCKNCGGALYAGEDVEWSREGGTRHLLPEQCAEVKALMSDPDFAKCTRCGNERIAHNFSDGEDNLECPNGSGQTFSREPQHAAPAPAAAPEQRSVEDGTYTAVAADGSYATVRIKTAGKNSALAGKRILSYLSGSDNERDFTGIGFFDGQIARLWKRFADSPRMQRYIDAVRAIAGDPQAAGFLYAQQSGNCYRCGRTLTVPASLSAGLGPECAKKI